MTHIVSVGIFIWPFFFVGLGVVAKKLVQTYKKSFEWVMIKEKRNVIMLTVILLTLLQYYLTPTKDIRYTFTLVAPLAYFSVVGLEEIKNKWKQAFSASIVAIVIFNFLFLSSYMQDGQFENGRKYNFAIEKAQELGINECRTMSNGWVLLNYFGKATEPHPDPRTLSQRISQGNVLLMFRSIEDPDWVRNYPFVHDFPIVFEDDQIIIINNGECLPVKKVNSTYMERLKETVEIVANVTINTNPCFILFGKAEVLERTCNLANLRGFVVDENRLDAARLETDLVY
jgi:hypothetical protein